MTISKDLFLSILAMDAYNRGYGAGIADGKGAKDGDGRDADGLGEAGSPIGGATVLNIPIPTGSQAAGFYAVAYEVNGVEGIDNGTRVISLRGVFNNEDIAEGRPLASGVAATGNQGSSGSASSGTDAVQISSGPMFRRPWSTRMISMSFPAIR